jgi:hypothetical protein
LAEHVLGKDEVTGSIPVIGSSIGLAEVASDVPLGLAEVAGDVPRLLVPGIRAVRIVEGLKGHHARQHRVGVHRVQAPELRHDQEQEEDDRASAAEEVLQLVPVSYAAPRDQVAE